MSAKKLSAILITRNEERQLEGCLQSLDFCDEIIIVDNSSSDNTVALARAHRATVIQTDDWPGFGLQKQRALDHATGEWALSIDADERVTPELRAEILHALKYPSANGFYIKRKSQFLGRWMRFGGWYPDYVLRLARRSSAQFDPVLVHEKLVVDGYTDKLDAHLLHFSYSSISDVLEKQKRYALLGSRKIRRKKNANISIIGAGMRSMWTFFRLYFVQLGLLDGRQGLISAVFKSQEVFWKYVAAEFEPPDHPSK